MCHRLLLAAGSRPTVIHYAVAFSYLAIASFAQSSQQTVISFPPTVTLTPPSLISQSHTGHFSAAIIASFF
jgi:hypothetical protein